MITKLNSLDRALRLPEQAAQNAPQADAGAVIHAVVRGATWVRQPPPATRRPQPKTLPDETLRRRPRCNAPFQARTADERAHVEAYTLHRRQANALRASQRCRKMSCVGAASVTGRKRGKQATRATAAWFGRARDCRGRSPGRAGPLEEVGSRGSSNPDIRPDEHRQSHASLYLALRRKQQISRRGFMATANVQHLVGANDIRRLLAGEGLEPLTPSRISQLVAEGMPKASRGQYDPQACLHWYIGYLHAKLAPGRTASTQKEWL